MKIILLGAPGAGKGTQAEKMSEKLNIPAISTGFIIRQAIADKTEIGIMAKEYIDKGLLLPDEVVIKLLLERLEKDDCKNGYILDGFPRTIAQAEALVTNNIFIDKVVDIELADERIVERLSGRRECSECGKTYHVAYHKPSVDGKCDACGAPLKRRKDDEPETIKNRLAVYHKQTEPLKEYYIKKGLLVAVDSQEEVAKTTDKVFEAMGVKL
ncbi:MAG: adenylate kinase [Clostridia bacterium]|nr:adenylate kinase [Clostridia bacterium]